MNIIESNPLPLDTALVIYNLLSNFGLSKNDKNTPLLKNIIIKEIPKTESIKNINIVDMCVIYFCEDEQLSKSEYFPLYSEILNYIGNIYGLNLNHSNVVISYDALIDQSTKSLQINNDFSYKRIYEDIFYGKQSKTELLNEISNKWENIDLDLKLQWLYFSFLSCDHITIKHLVSKHGDSIWHTFIQNCKEENDLNSLFEFMLLNFQNWGKWEYFSKLDSNIHLKFIQFISENEIINKHLIANLNDEFKTTYISIKEAIKELGIN